MKKVWTLLCYLGRNKTSEDCVTAIARMEQRVAAIELAVARTGAARREQHAANRGISQSAAPALADLLVHLPRLKTTSAGNVDFAASDATLLTTLADNAETAYKIVLRGVAAMGSLMVHSGPEIEDGSLSADTVEAIGLLLAELGELSGMLVALQGNCRRVAS